MKFLRIQRLCLHSLGFTFEKDESRLWKMYSLFHPISMLIIIIPEWNFIFENISDIPTLTDALCTMLSSILSIAKIMTMYIKKNKFYRVIVQLDDMWLKCIRIIFSGASVLVSDITLIELSSKSDRLILEQGHKIGRRLTLCYLLSSIGAAGLYLIYPILKAIYELQTTGAAEWIMPITSIFPYDISVSPNYELTYLWFVQCTYAAGIGSVGVDCLFYGSSFNISSHFQIIQKKIRNMKFHQITVEQKKRSGKRVATDEFFQLIEYHQNLLNICDEFQEMYLEVLFIQFLITSALLCLIGFQLTLPKQQWLKLIIFGFFMISIFFELFIYCHAGSQLTTESLAVSDAIYNSNWYEATISFQKLMGFFLMRSQRPVIMSSGFHFADLATLNAIISAAFSYMTILQSLSEE